MGGGTYARRLYNAFSVGTTASYVADPYSAPTGHGGAHQPDEHLPIAPFLEAAALVTDMLLRLTSL
jgi:acetylornithine deacetylase/succinyl-diaminopimelate desuccinylase-like protein